MTYCATRIVREAFKLLERFFEMIRRTGLTLNPTKCRMDFLKVVFVGHGVGMDSKSPPSKENVNTIRDVMKSKTKENLRSFLGFVNFSREYIPDMLQWTQDMEDASRKLNYALISEPILKLTDPNLKFYLRTDGCTTCIESIHLQEIDGTKWPFCYVSRKLLDRERKNSVSELEILAKVFCATKLRSHFGGRTFVIETAHNALTFLNQRRSVIGRLIRWYLEVVKGKDNTSDHLSRSFEDQ